MEATLEHPFFVFRQGWSSCSPDRTESRYGLQCHKLRVGDVCISLTQRETSRMISESISSAASRPGSPVQDRVTATRARSPRPTHVTGNGEMEVAGESTSASKMPPPMTPVGLSRDRVRETQSDLPLPHRGTLEGSTVSSEASPMETSTVSGWALSEHSMLYTTSPTGNIRPRKRRRWSDPSVVRPTEDSENTDPVTGTTTRPGPSTPPHSVTVTNPNGYPVSRHT